MGEVPEKVGWKEGSRGGYSRCLAVIRGSGALPNELTKTSARDVLGVIWQRSHFEVLMCGRVRQEAIRLPGGQHFFSLTFQG